MATNEAIVKKKEMQLNFLKGTLIACMITGALVIAYWCYVDFFLGSMAKKDGTVLNSMNGLSVIIVSSALGFAASMIKFNHLREVISDDTLHQSLQQFMTRTSQFIYTSQGILITNAFSFIFWAWYTSANNVTQYQDKAGQLHDFTSQNMIWLGLMVLAVVASALNLFAAVQLDRKEKSSKKNATIKKTRR